MRFRSKQYGTQNVECSVKIPNSFLGEFTLLFDVAPQALSRLALLAGKYPPPPPRQYGIAFARLFRSWQPTGADEHPFSLGVSAKPSCAVDARAVELGQHSFSFRRPESRHRERCTFAALGREVRLATRHSRLRREVTVRLPTGLEAQVQPIRWRIGTYRAITLPQHPSRYVPTRCVSSIQTC